MVRLGAHESVSGGLHLAFDRIVDVGGEALQIFTRNQRQWKTAPLKEDEIVLFKERWQKTPEMEVVSHGSYLINLASSDPTHQEKARAALVAELERCMILGIEKVVLHPGSHGGDGVERGLEQVITALDAVFHRAKSDSRILIETTAGQGTGLGADFEEIAAILSGSRFTKRLGVCFDTCHVFAAGYDLRDSRAYEKTMAKFDSAIGCDRIEFFHLNDSKKELGSRRDRHEHIGAGFIGIEGFRALLNDNRFVNHSMTLETPKGKDLKEDRQNLKLLRSLVAG